MDICEELFKKYRVNYDSLIKYGFVKDNDGYKYETLIMDDSLKVIILVSGDGKIRGRIFDVLLGDEYINYRLSVVEGEYAKRVKETFVEILMDIRDKCFEEKVFDCEQANRIAKLIFNKYGDKPEFVWDMYPSDAIYRNPINRKWYGLMMEIDGVKIGVRNGMIGIINVKLSNVKIKELLGRDGFYPAYHMNKNNWITMILDDTLDDLEIMKYVILSHELTEEIRRWIVPANPKYFDVISYFNGFDVVEWPLHCKAMIGDIVYVYVAKPYSAIMFKCEVVETDIAYDYKDSNISMNRVMRIKLLNRYDEGLYNKELLGRFGVKAIRGARRMPRELEEYINSGKN